MRFRQIHLDFHTSEKISGVGSKFDARQFQEQLKRGHVDSVTLFSKCHHGCSYHDTSVGFRHPGMATELLPRQIEACKAIGVKTPIYISAGFDEFAARVHPDWCVVQKDGSIGNPLTAGWKLMNLNSPYLDYLCAQIEEVIEKFDGGDGIFLDIIAPWKSYDARSLADMREQGIDPDNDEQTTAFAQAVLQKYYECTTASCHKKNPDLPVFHNSGHIAKGATDVLRWQSHLELESLPTGGWGYDHFPISAKYAATTGKTYLGMTGKFHTTWGEFGGFKRPEALRYECAAMLAFGARCSIGDQLHPSGEMNEDTYQLIGAAYSQVEENEKYVVGAEPVSEIALVSPEAARHGGFSGHTTRNDAEEGAARMLLELHQQFDVVDLDRDLASYKLVVLPDEITFESAFADKIKQFVADGGKVLLSGKSGMNAEATKFVLDTGLNVEGKSEWDPDYVIPTDLAPTAPVRGAFVVHGGAWNVTPDAGTRVLARRAASYFNRSWEHFCSHQHTPNEKEIHNPAATSNGQIAYFAHSIFTSYRQLGQPLYRDLVSDAIIDLLAKSSTRFDNFPSQARVALTRQTDASRYVLHLLYATPVKRGADKSRFASPETSVEIIEDIVPLFEIACSININEQVKSVQLAPSGQALEYSQEGDVVRFVVPRLLCHQMIELSY